MKYRFRKDLKMEKLKLKTLEVPLAQGLTVIIDFEKYSCVTILSGKDKYVVYNQHETLMVISGLTPFWELEKT